MQERMLMKQQITMLLSKRRPKASHGRVHTLFICVRMTFLTWRGRVHANNGMDESTPS
jgi:hypothetical protein